MNEAVLDASVVVEWFSAGGDPSARVLRAEFEAGMLAVVAPPLLLLEVLNVAAKRWRWSVDGVRAMGSDLRAIPFHFMEPDIRTVTEWVVAGLSAYDAAYVAVAETAGMPLLTLDEQILESAPGVARRPSAE